MHDLFEPRILDSNLDELSAFAETYFEELTLEIVHQLAHLTESQLKSRDCMV